MNDDMCKGVFLGVLATIVLLSLMGKI